MNDLVVARAGYLATVQDLGRFGHRQRGVSLAGALDTNALRVANLLVGNDPASAGIEATFGTLRLGFRDERLVAWCGGSFQVDIAGARLAPGRVALLRGGEELTMTAPQQGARAWLAISGGIDVPIVLGSRSTDVRSGFGGLGGRALQAGDLLPLARPSEIGARIAEKLRLASLASWSAPNEWSHTTRTHEFLRFVRGADWLDLSEKARASFVHETFTVAADSDRMGVRLKGLPLPQSRMADTLSGAVAPGTVQLPPGGQPILLLGDCQTIGGYRKIAHVITIDLPAAAQLAAGDAIRFVEVTLAEAQRWLIEREQEVARFRIGLELQTP